MIYIGCFDLSGLNERAYQQLYSLASRERQAKADRYLRPDDALRCVAADALLRYALRHTFGTHRLETARTPEGKPYLPEKPDFHFNLSHSGHWAVIAWGSCPMGIDVEMIHMDESKEQVARRFFCPDEQEDLFSVRAQERAVRFFEIWTKKESYLKYEGTGMNRSLSSFSVLMPRKLGICFTGRILQDAVLTLCAQDSECQFLPLTLEMLISE